MTDISIKDTQSTLTTEEYNSYVTYFGDGVVGDVNADDILYYLMNPDEIPEGMNVDDLLMFYIDIADAMPPDDASLDYLWTDADVQTAMQEFVLDWQDTGSLTSAVEQAQALLLEQGISTDTINQIADQIQGWIDTNGTLTSSSATFFTDMSAELEELTTLMKTLKPQNWLMLYMMYFAGPMMSELLDESLTQREDRNEQRQEILDGYNGIDTTSEDATVEMKDLEFQEKNLDELERLANELDESIFDWIGKLNEHISAMENIDKNALSTINRGLGA